MKNVNHIKKTKLILTFAICFAIIICAMLTVNSIGANKIVAHAASGQFEITQGMYDDFTNSDYILNGTKRIHDYPNSSLYRSTSSISRTNNTFQLSITNDDPIIQIVPKELFSYIGNHLYIGKEYGFYIKTVAERYDYKDANNDWQSTTSAYNRKSTVLVFDIKTESKWQDTTDRFIISLSPLYQYDFVYADNRVTTFTLEKSNRFSEQVSYSISSPKVIPIGEVNSSNNIAFGQVEKYYLKDISFVTRLYNEQAPNDFLPSNQYSAINDMGSYITGYDYEYDGISIKNKNQHIAETVLLGLNEASYLLGVASLFPLPPPVQQILGISSAVAGFPGFVINTVDLFNHAFDDGQVAVNSGKLTYTPYYKTKPHQINQYGKLIKTAGVAINTGTSQSIWYKAGSSATAYFDISNSAPNLESEFQTRFVREIGLQVVNANGDMQAIETSSYDFIEGNPNLETLVLENNGNVYLLYNGTNHYDFYAQYTSTYKIKVNSSQNMTIKINDALVSGSNNEFRVKLAANSINKIELIGGNATVTSTISIEPDTNISSYAVNSKEEYLVKYLYTGNSGLNNLSSGTGTVITNICVANTNGVLNRVEFLDNFKNNISVDIFLAKNKSYYILVNNTSSSSINNSIVVNSLSYEILMSNNSSRTIPQQDNFRYYKFNAPSGGISDYVFLFSGITNTTDIFNFRVIDQNGNIYNSVTQYSYGYLKIYSMQPNTTYYIGIYSSVSKSTTPTVQKTEATYKWKIMQGSTVMRNDSQTAITLTRGYTYKFELWLNDTVKVRNIAISTDNYSGIGLNSINNQTGSINITSDRRDGTNFTIVGKYEGIEGLSYSHALLVNVTYNVDEFSFNAIDYYNAIKISWPAKSDVISINYTVSGLNENNASFSFSGSNITNLYVDCLQQLISSKAVRNVTFTITKVKIYSGASNATREVNVSRSIDINCLYSKYEKKTVLLIFTTHYYYVSNALQIYNIRNEMGYNRYLDTDINMSYYGATWSPIPTLNCNIYGQNYKLINLKITIPANIGNESFYGFVGINNSTISGLNISGVVADSTGGSHNLPWVNVGAIAGRNSGTITNCNVTGTLNVHHNNSRAGGLVGHNNGNINNSSFGSFSAAGSLVNGNGDLGGIAGQSNGTITYCNVYNARVQSYICYTNRSSGGIVGYNYGGEISYCNVYAVEIAYTGYGFISASDLKPNMGIIVGHIENSNLWYVGRDNAGVNTGSLTAQQRANCANGPWGVYGVAVNTSVK